MKRIVSILICLVLMSALVLSVSAASGSVSISASKTNLKPGDTFTVTATLSSSDAIKLGTVVLSYDTNALEMTGGTCHVSGANPAVVVPANKAGTFFLGEARVVSGQIFTFNFKVKDTAAYQSYTISTTASIGVSTGEYINASGTTVSVVCDHSYGAWTDAGDGNHSQTCPTCKDVKTEAHKWDKGTVIEPATCKDAGKTKYTCTVCKATKEENVPAANPDLHKFGNLTAVDDNNHKDTCQVCKKEITSPHAWDKGTVTKEPTCKDTGTRKLTCGECGHTKNETIPIPDPAPHKFGNLTAVDDKNHKDTCQVCNKEITSAHTWNSGAVTKKPTCTEEGEKTFTCTGCKATKKESVDKLDHKFGAWEKVDAENHKRTCTLCKEETETGKHNYKTSWSKDAKNHWHECAECKDKKDSEAHKPGPEATEKNPQLCTVCNYIIKPALEHKHNYADKWTTDEKGHWYVCDGCEEKGSYADHDFENACDKDCSVCGFTRETEHTFEDKWVTDGENHWHECTGCGLKQDEGAHEPGPAATETSAQTCTICDYEVAPKLEPAPVNKAPVEDPNNFPWWIVIVGAVALVVVILVFTTKKKKV